MSFNTIQHNAKKPYFSYILRTTGLFSNSTITFATEIDEIDAF